MLLYVTARYYYRTFTGQNPVITEECRPRSSDNIDPATNWPLFTVLRTFLSQVVVAGWQDCSHHQKEIFLSFQSTASSFASKVPFPPDPSLLTPEQSTTVSTLDYSTLQFYWPSYFPSIPYGHTAIPASQAQDFGWNLIVGRYSRRR